MTNQNDELEKIFLSVLLVGGYDTFSTSIGPFFELEKMLTTSFRNLEVVGNSFLDRTPRDSYNTVFVDPFGVYGHISDGLNYMMATRYLVPQVAFVLFTNAANRHLLFDSSFQKMHSNYLPFFDRLEHYFHLEQPLNGDVKSLQLIIDQCRLWHSKLAQTPVRRYKYDVAISFAGEDRSYAEQLAYILRFHDISVFYDNFEKASLWGKDLYTYLHEVYSNRSRYCVIFVSKHYLQKNWTSHERRAAQERALEERGNDYILPIRIDATKLPGMNLTTGYIDVSEGIGNIAGILIQKLEDRSFFMVPPLPGSLKD